MLSIALNRTHFGAAKRPTLTSRAWFPAPRGPDAGAILCVSYSAAQERLYDLNHPNSHPVVPISSARSDQIRRVQSLVSALKLRKLGSECQATDQSVKQEQLLRAHRKAGTSQRQNKIECLFTSLNNSLRRSAAKLLPRF
jgi:hypothetical protein